MSEYIVHVCRGHAEGKSAHQIYVECPNCWMCQVSNCFKMAEYFIQIQSED